MLVNLTSNIKMDLENENISLQADEIEALSSIYGSQWEADSKIPNSFIFRVSPEVHMFITLNKEYPSNSPPIYQLLAPELHVTVKTYIHEELKRIFDENCGTPIIFQWLDRIKEIIEANRKSDYKESEIVRNPKQDLTEEEQFVSFDVIHGPIVEDRKSVFQGHTCKIFSEQDVKQFIYFLKQTKKIAQATHNVLAYRIKRDEILYQDYDDDGETHAGQRLLHLLQILNVINVVVVVSRWYGGIHLGPKRFQHINNAARQVLDEAKFLK